MTEFEITKDHLTLLKNAEWSWDDCEYGSPEIDCKRPFGYSCTVEEDMVKILGGEFFVDKDGEKHISQEQAQYVRKIYRELRIVLEICCATLSFVPGCYTRTGDYNKDWKLEYI